MRSLDLLGLAALALPLAACGTTGGDDDAADDDLADDDSTPGDPCEGLSTTASLLDVSNYAFDGALTLQSVPLADGSDPLIDWGGLTQDIQLHDLDPVADIDAVSVVLFRYLTEEEVARALSEDTLVQADVQLFVSTDPGDATSARLSELTLLGNDIDVEQFFDEGYGTWLLTVNTGTTPGVGARMATFIRPVVGEPATEVVLADDSAVLDFKVDLTSASPLEVPAATPGLTVGWSGLTTDAQGNPFEPADVDQLMLGRYDGLAAADLEAVFLDLLLLADPLFTLDLSGGTSADLSLASGEDGAFAGVDGEATWVLALLCTTCANPAPPFLTLLEPCE